MIIWNISLTRLVIVHSTEWHLNPEVTFLCRSHAPPTANIVENLPHDKLNHPQLNWLWSRIRVLIHIAWVLYWTSGTNNMSHYLHQMAEVNVFILVDLSFCLFVCCLFVCCFIVSNISRKHKNEFAWNFQERSDMEIGTFWHILGLIISGMDCSTFLKLRLYPQAASCLDVIICSRQNFNSIMVIDSITLIFVVAQKTKYIQISGHKSLWKTVSR